MLTRFLVLSVVAVVATQASSEFSSWNELVRGKDIFGDEINSIQAKSSEGLVKQLGTLLNKEGVLETLYNNYQSVYSKDSPTPKEYKMTAFKNNLIDIAAHNLAAQNGEHSWFKGINQFTDMTEQELDLMYSVNVSAWSDIITPTPVDQLPVSSINSINPTAAPDALDWGTSGAITSVKDQNQCNSCVMFAFTAQLEAVTALTKRKVTPDLSPQECLDCAVRNFVCSDPGTDPMDTLRYLTNNGVTTWENYPYPIPPQKLACRASGRARAAQVNQNGVVQNVDEETLKEYLATYGPLMVTIYTGYSYNGGILDNSACGNNRANHAVTLVGYGTHNGMDYWKIKNSYGPNWGEQGYLFLRRNNGHACQIGSWAFIVTAK